MTLWNICLEKSQGKLNKTIPAFVLQAAFAGAAVAFWGFVSAYVLTLTGSSALAGIVFSMALLTILTFKWELFTGNCLLAVPVVEGQSSVGQPMARLWLSFWGNLIGGALMALVLLHFVLPLLDARLAVTLLGSVYAKSNLLWIDAFFRGIGCNLLVCGGTLTFWRLKGPVKVVATSLLITLFVMSGFEHIVANFLYWTLAVTLVQPIGWVNVVMVTLGNVAGGLLVVWWMNVCRRQAAAD